jgi:hypothetical protein
LRSIAQRVGEIARSHGQSENDDNVGGDVGVKCWKTVSMVR